MKNILLNMIVAFAVVIVLAATSSADVPKMVNYQGRLTDSAGAALDTTISMYFTIYADSGGTQNLWREEHPSVAVGSGLFDVLLGSISPIGPSVFNGDTRWLGVQLGSGPESRPLIPMVSVGYAYRSGKSDTATVALNGGSLWLQSGSDIYYNDGNVGIGTATPTHKLHVLGDVSTSTQYRIGDNPVLHAFGNSNIGVGSGAGENNTGTWSTFVGAYTAPNNEGHNNVFLGRSTGYYHTTGDNNTFLGHVAGYNNVSGARNTFVGMDAGRNATGDDNVFLGRGAGYSEAGSNRLYIDNSSVGTPLLYGDFSTNRLGVNTKTLSYTFNVDGTLYSLGNGSGFKFKSRNGGMFPVTYTWYADNNIARLYSYWVMGGGKDLIGITSGGNTGIGTIAPGQHRLYVYSGGHRVLGATSYFHNTSDSGIAILAENNSDDATAVFLQRGIGDVLRCFYIDGGGGWNFTFRVTQEGRAICNVLELLGGSDIAEPFEMSHGKVKAGALVVIDEKNPGKLKLSNEAYDTKVAGIVSGAGGVKPGLTLTQKEVFKDGQNVAISGRVYCLADASHGPIEAGDLLTTSDTPGHAMTASDRGRAYGSVIGKAMTPLKEGKGLVLVLVNLQ
jgi:hypothetical protein